MLRPLLGFDKDEIIDLARRIGTYELSAKVPEYCALHGRSPATAVRAADLDIAERSIDLAAFAAEVAESPRIDLRARRRPGPGTTEPLAIDHVPDGAVVIDLRSPNAFAAWHYPDAVRMDYTDALRARLIVLDDAVRADNAEEIATRMPWFCSGCPHNTSTRLPPGARGYAGIGCHYMVRWMDRNTDEFTHMGGEGANWIGQAPRCDGDSGETPFDP